MADNPSSTLESLRKSKDKLDAAQRTGTDETLAGRTAADLAKRRKKTYSLTNRSILAIERIRFEAAKEGKNLSASDVVDEAILLLLKQKELSL